MLPQTDDQTLAQWLLESKYGLLISAHYMKGKLRRALSRALGTRSMESMEDALQEVYLRLWRQGSRHAASPHNIHDIDGYVCAVARNVAWSWRERERRREFAIGGDAHPIVQDLLRNILDSEACPETIVSTQQEIASALSVLPREQAEVLLLVKGQGYAIDEAGAALGLTARKVRKHLRQATFHLDKSRTRRADRPQEAQTTLLYDLRQKIRVPSEELVQCLSPKVVVANAALAEQLKKHPDALRNLEPRQFEQLIAEIVEDWGWDVHLTPAARDGGMDVLASLDTELGRLMWLIEAKHYGPHRKVGFDLVQRLYGAYASYGATHGMLVTTSTFTAPAREFQAKHQYHLTLREYQDVRNWIENYGRAPDFNRGIEADPRALARLRVTRHPWR